METEYNAEKWYIVSLTDKAFISLSRNAQGELEWSIVDNPESALRYTGGNIPANGLTLSKLSKKFGGKIMKLKFSTTMALEDLGE